MDTNTKTQPQDLLAHLDAEIVQKLQDIGNRVSEDTFVKNLLERFLHGTPERLLALQDAVAAGDCETIEFQAHTLKSSCGYVGATVMVEICKTLESLGRAKEIRDAGRLVAELQKSFALVTPRLRSLLAGSDDALPETADNCQSVDG
ncbi:MAG: Hpt domain-containing protein [Gammaproteobacteria bacterium]|nr:Hpt domain-containing protein [Gammaproteobacteria bacterium]